MYGRISQDIEERKLEEFMSHKNYIDYIAENLEKNIAYTDYIAENLGTNVAYSEYLAASLDGNLKWNMRRESRRKKIKSIFK